LREYALLWRGNTGRSTSEGLQVRAGPREVDFPPDFAAALAADKAAGAFFATLSNSMQRYHVDSIDGAKTDETRQRRIAKAVALFRDGKQR